MWNVRYTASLEGCQSLNWRSKKQAGWCQWSHCGYLWSPSPKSQNDIPHSTSCCNLAEDTNLADLCFTPYFLKGILQRLWVKFFKIHIFENIFFCNLSNLCIQILEIIKKDYKNMKRVIHNLFKWHIYSIQKTQCLFWARMQIYVLPMGLFFSIALGLILPSPPLRRPLNYP